MDGVRQLFSLTPSYNCLLRKLVQLNSIRPPHMEISGYATEKFQSGQPIAIKTDFKIYLQSTAASGLRSLHRNIFSVRCKLWRIQVRSPFYIPKHAANVAKYSPVSSAVISNSLQGCWRFLSFRFKMWYPLIAFLICF